MRNEGGGGEVRGRPRDTLMIFCRTITGKVNEVNKSQREYKRVNDDELGGQSTLKCPSKERPMNAVRCQLSNSSWPLLLASVSLRQPTRLTQLYAAAKFNKIQVIVLKKKLDISLSLSPLPLPSTLPPFPLRSQYKTRIIFKISVYKNAVTIKLTELT